MKLVKPVLRLSRMKPLQLEREFLLLQLKSMINQFQVLIMELVKRPESTKHGNKMKLNFTDKFLEM